MVLWDVGVIAQHTVILITEALVCSDELFLPLAAVLPQVLFQPTQGLTCKFNTKSFVRWFGVVEIKLSAEMKLILFALSRIRISEDISWRNILALRPLTISFQRLNQSISTSGMNVLLDHQFILVP